MAYEQELAFAVALAKEAGEIARKHFSAGIAYENKSDNSPVTVADNDINALVIERCAEAYPGVGVLGEEQSSKDVGTKSLWVCDPIDGTIPYTLGIPASTFCLAYVVEGVPQVGVVYDFNSDNLFAAVRGGAATLNGEQLTSIAGAQPMKLVNLEWYHAAKYNLQGVREKLFAEQYQVPNYATGAFIAMRVAQGRVAAGIYSGDKSWDIAALKVIVEACGGVVTDLGGEEQRYDGSIKGAIIAHPTYHEHLVQLVDYKS